MYSKRATKIERLKKLRPLSIDTVCLSATTKHLWNFEMIELDIPIQTHINIISDNYFAIYNNFKQGNTCDGRK